MELKDFIEKFANQFEETDASEINENTVIMELDEWSSLTAIFVISMVREEYGVSINGKDIRQANTVGDLFQIIQSRL
jgi:acyl carrier protein